MVCWPGALAGVAAASLVAAAATPAAAGEADGDARKARAHFEKLGRRVGRLAPMLLTRGERRALVPYGTRHPHKGNCTTVVVLAHRRLHFVVRFAGDTGDDAWPVKSVAGMAEVVRCGSDQSRLRRLQVEARSPRTIVETLVIEGPVPGPRMRRVLPHRDPGAVIAARGAGPRPAPTPLELRAKAFLTRARRQGAASVGKRRLTIGRDAVARSVYVLPSGCYRFDVLGPDRKTALDIDAELHRAGDDAPVDADRSPGTDPTVTGCLGRPGRLLLEATGGPPGTRLDVLTARWPLPDRLPERWGPDARARMAKLLLGTRLAASTPPVADWLGVQGATQLPLPVVAGRCYEAAVVALGSAPSDLGIVATLPGPVRRRTVHEDHAADGDHGARIAFCARRSGAASVQVQGRGSTLIWLLAVWERGVSARTREGSP